MHAAGTFTCPIPLNLIMLGASVQKNRHTVLHCIPLDEDCDQRDLAPMIFKKAIMESDEQWSQHKKLIDFRKKGLRRCVPKNFPYFAVSFGELVDLHPCRRPRIMLPTHASPAGVRRALCIGESKPKSPTSPNQTPV